MMFKRLRNWLKSRRMDVTHKPDPVPHGQSATVEPCPLSTEQLLQEKMSAAMDDGETTVEIMPGGLTGSRTEILAQQMESSLLPESARIILRNICHPKVSEMGVGPPHKREERIRLALLLAGNDRDPSYIIQDVPKKVARIYGLEQKLKASLSCRQTTEEFLNS